jgi:trimeric autotransporter adhesin
MTLARRRSAHFGNVGAARSGLLTALVLVLLTTAGGAQRSLNFSNIIDDRSDQRLPADSNQPLGPTRNPGIGALPPVAQAQISAAIGEDERAYHALAQLHGFRLDNANHDVSAEFTPTGVEFRHGANRWGLALRGYGYGEALRGAAGTLPTANANRVEYRRAGLTEWYVNGPLGVEQGFTLERAPERSNGKPLTLAIALSGNLTPSVAPGARALTLSKEGAVALRYAGLTAWDADRRELRAWLEVAGDQLRVQVDDVDARYPVTIDPYVQARKLTTAKPCDPSGVCDDGAPGDQFGYAVSISADASTVVVGVPFKYTNSFARGAAYVFVKPTDAGGWNSIFPTLYKAKLLASDGATNGLFLGYSVDISRDGGTIVAGARRFGTGSGAAYVFVRPTSGWGTNQVQIETAKLTADPNGTGVDLGSFGHAVSMSGDGGTIAVAAPEYAVAVVSSGAAYTFLRPATGWVNATESQKLTGTEMSRYGSSVALSDDATILAIGAANENPNGGAANFIGTTHVLARRTNSGSSDSYSDVAKLVPSNGLPRDLFGYSVSVAGDGRTIVVGAPVMEDDTPPHPGTAYVFVRPSRGWGVPKFTMTETARLTSSDAFENDEFAQAVEISADGLTILASAIEPPVLPGTLPGSGAGYLFGRPPAGWSTSTENTKSRSEDGFLYIEDLFGFSVALSGDGRVSVIGAPFQTLNANSAQGAAYVFTGSAADPIASVSPSNLTFAPQSIGTTSSPQTVTVTNTGASPLHVSSVSATSQFFTTQNCVAASPIAVGSSCSESVTFAPLTVEQFFGAVGFTDDGGGATPTTQFVQLQGTGKKANTSTTITSISATRVLPGQSVMVSYSVASEPGSTLSPFGPITVQATTGESCMGGPLSNGCTLTFLSPGSRTITAAYNGNSSFNPSTSAGVTVDVADFSLSVTPASQSITGKKATYTLSVVPLTGSSGTVALTCSGGPANTTCAVSPSSVNLAGGTATTKATVSLPNGVNVGTYTITFTGGFGSATRSTTASLTVK